MDRAVLLEHLRLAESHVAEGHERIVRQHEIVARGGLGSRHARALLDKFEALQALHIADCERLASALSGGTCTYIGAYHFGERARWHLRRAETTVEQYAEHLTAIREQVRSCEAIIDDCKTTMERIERLLHSLAA